MARKLWKVGTQLCCALSYKANVAQFPGRADLHIFLSKNKNNPFLFFAAKKRYCARTELEIVCPVNWCCVTSCRNLAPVTCVDFSFNLRVLRKHCCKLSKLFLLVTYSSTPCIIQYFAVGKVKKLSTFCKLQNLSVWDKLQRDLRVQQSLTQPTKVRWWDKLNTNMLRVTTTCLFYCS